MSAFCEMYLEIMFEIFPKASKKNKAYAYCQHINFADRCANYFFCFLFGIGLLAEGNYAVGGLLLAGAILSTAAQIAASIYFYCKNNKE